MRRQWKTVDKRFRLCYICLKIDKGMERKLS